MARRCSSSALAWPCAAERGSPPWLERELLRCSSSARCRHSCLWYVGNGFHMVAALYGLIAFGLLGHRGFGWRWAAATALLAFGILGDLELAVFACAPLAAAGVFDVVTERRWLAGADLVAAGGISVVLGAAVLRFVRLAGGFVPGPALRRAHGHQLLVNVAHVFTYGAQLLGIDNGRFGTGGEAQVLLGLHAIGGVLVVVCILGAAARTVGRSAPAHLGIEWRV